MAQCSKSDLAKRFGRRRYGSATLMAAMVAGFAGMIGAMGGCESQSTIAAPLPIVRPVMRWQGARPAVAERPRTGRGVDWNVGADRNWIPPGHLEQKGRWRGIIIHHSATDWGNAQEFDELHKKRRDRNGEKWLGLGYDFVVDNGRGGPDGRVETGWRWHKQVTGAHCRPKGCRDNYWNEHTIGICLVGNFEKYRPSQSQYASLARLVRFLQKRYDIPLKQVKGHGQVAGARTQCPGRLFSWWELKRRLRK